jgi:hypothetical protein
MNSIKKALHRHRDDEVGGVSAEFIAVMVIVAALIAALWAADFHGKSSTCATDASNRLFTANEMDALPDC